LLRFYPLGKYKCMIQMVHVLPIAPRRPHITHITKHNLFYRCTILHNLFTESLFISICSEFHRGLPPVEAKFYTFHECVVQPLNVDNRSVVPLFGVQLRDKYAPTFITDTPSACPSISVL
jgi:hypothetical protein